MAEQVNHPNHYGGDTTYEVIKVLEAWKIQDPLVWNTIKYLARAGKKPGVDELTDLQKAAWYLARRIQQVEHQRTEERLEEEDEEKDEEKDEF